MKKLAAILILFFALSPIAVAQQQNTQGSFSITVTAHYVALSWSASPSGNVAGYNLYRASTSSGPWVKLNGSLVIVQTSKDTNVMAGSTYYYVCTAVGTDGVESPHSNVSSATVQKP